jgi:ribonucleotide reductase beta subunit family protein with ferritin-like domain
MSVFIESESYRPFKYPFAVEAEKEQFIDTYWHEGQIDLQDDLRQYHGKDGLGTPNFSHVENKKKLDTLLLFFTQLDMSVASGYVELLSYTKNNEIKSLFIQQAAKEVRHQRAYALAGETFGFTDADWSAFRQYKEMISKVDVMGITTHPLDTPLGYALKLTRILLGEGIGLFVAFSSLLNYKRFGLLIGFNDVNSWSLLDEHCHVRNNIKVLHEVILELSPQDRLALIAETKKMVDDYVEVEHSLVDLLGGNEGITSEQHKDYISYLGKLRLFEIGYIGKLEVPENPMPWMDSMLGAERHGAFFEKRITDYSHRKLEGVVNYTKYQTLLS